jgi:hypothetical protein
MRLAIIQNETPEARKANIFLNRLELIAQKVEIVFDATKNETTVKIEGKAVDADIVAEDLPISEINGVVYYPIKGEELL